MSFTLENSFFGFNNKHYSVEDFNEIGGNLLLSI